MAKQMLTPDDHNPFGGYASDDKLDEHDCDEEAAPLASHGGGGGGGGGSRGGCTRIRRFVADSNSILVMICLPVGVRKASFLSEPGLIEALMPIK